MKNYLKIIAILVALLLVGCKDDNPTGDDSGNKDGGSNPLTEAGLVYEVNGKKYEINGSFVMSHTPVADYLTIVAPSAIGIQLRTLPNATGTYTHDGNSNIYRRYNVWFPHEGVTYYADNEKGSSTITLTEVGTMSITPGEYEGAIKGSFSGVFVSENGESIAVENGYFFTKNKSTE